MDIPTPEQLRAVSASLRQHYPDDSEHNAELAALAAVTGPLVGSLTGRIIGGGSEQGAEDVPDYLDPLAILTIAMKTDQFDSAIRTVKGRRQSLTRGNLASFSAGSYSESYFGPQQAQAAKQLDPDPRLAELLWALCTDAKRLYWLSFWDPEDFPTGEGGLVAFEYGNRPNYTPRAGWPGW